MYEVTVEAGFLLRPLSPQLQGQVREPARPQLQGPRHAGRRELDEAGLLLDFKLLKQVLRPVIDRIDHQMLNDLEPFTVLNPSAENIAKYFYDQTNRAAGRNDRGPRAREGLHHLGDGHDHGYLLRVDGSMRSCGGLSGVALRSRAIHRLRVAARPFSACAAVLSARRGSPRFALSAM